MRDEIQDLKCRIYRLEDNLLRCKDYQEQIRMKAVLDSWRKKLQIMTWDRNAQQPRGE